MGLVCSQSKAPANVASAPGAVTGQRRSDVTEATTATPPIDFRHANKQGLRAQVFRRDDFTCQACGVHPTLAPDNYDGRYAVTLDDGRVLHIDHRRPRVRGGRSRLRNLQTLCSSCNSRKAGH